VTALCGLSIPGGNLVAFILSGIIFKGIENTDSQGVEDMLNQAIMVTNYWITFICIPYMFMIKDKPILPPS